jgi:hypothetical protein
MSEVNLVAASEAYSRAKSGSALLVCAYESDEKFRNVHLEGALSLDEFKSKLDTIDRGKEIIFYCA